MPLLSRLTGPRIVLRAAEERDIPFLVTARNEARQAFFDTRAVDHAGTRRWLHASAAAGEQNWLIEAGGTPVGTLAVIPHAGQGVEVGRLIVVPAFRGHGYMEEALRVVLPHLASIHPGPIFLEVKPDNQAAIHIYRKVAFEVTRVRMEWHDPAV